MSSFYEFNHKTIQKAFNDFDKNNPQVYKEFKKMVTAAMKVGKKKLSAKLILNVIRWNIYMETKDDTGFTDRDGTEYKFRINDAYTSRYARKYIADFPRREYLFNYRELRSP